VRVDRERFLAELGARGMTVAALAEAANVSEGTIYNAMAGRPVKMTSLRLIAGAFERTPIVAGLSDLIET